MRKRGMWLALALLALSAGLYGLWPDPTSGAPSTSGRAQPTERAGQAQAVVDALLAAPLPPPKGELSLHGVVRDAQGPVAGATVVAVQGGAAPLAEAVCGCPEACGMKLAACGCWHAAEQLRARLAEQRDALQPVARTTTDAQGAFTLAGLEAGSYTVWAQAGPRGSAVREGLAPGAEAELLLELPASFTGKVLDRENHKALAGAHLVLMLARHPYVAETDAASDGSFAFAHLPAGDYVLLAEREGYLPWHQRVHGPVARLEVQLGRPQVLRGLVRRGEAPAPGVEVTLEGAHRHERAQSAADGSFAFAGLAQDSYTLRATSGRELAQATGQAGPREEPVELQLSAGGEVTGQVLDAHGQPVVGARVELKVTPGASPTARRHAWEAQANATTGPEGRFRLSAPVGEGTLRVSADGYQDGQDGPFPVEAERAAERRVTLARAALLRGVVVDARGQPVEGANVYYSAASPGPDDEEGVSGYTTTGPDGRFAIDHLAPGRYQLQAQHEGYLNAQAEAEAPAEGLRLALRDGLALRGRVLDPEGQPVPGAGVTAIPAALSPLNRHRGEEPQPSQDRPQVRETTTDARGAFALGGLVAGPYAVVASEHGAISHSNALGAGRVASREVELRPGPAQEVELRLEAGLAVRGQVLDAQGQPVAGAQVEVSARRVADLSSMAHLLESAPRLVESGQDGRFEVPGLGAGEYQLRAFHPEYALEEGAGATAQAGGEPVTLTLIRRGKVRGRVLGPGGAPLAAYTLNGRPVHDPAGAFEEEVFRDGEVELQFEATGLAPARRLASGKAGQEVVLPDVTLGPGRALQGRVIEKASGAPVAGARVGLEPPGPEPAEPDAAGSALTGADGTFRLEGLEAGPVEVYASHPDYGLTQATAPAGGGEVVLAFEPAGTIEGRCADAQGQPLQGEITAQPSAPGAAPGPSTGRFTQLEGDGSYRLKGLRAGRYAVRLSLTGPEGSLGDLSLAPRQVEVAAGATVRVDFLASGGATLRVRLVTVSGAPALGKAVLIPGQATAPTTAQALSDLKHLGARGASEGPGSWTFKGVSAGHYTLLFIVAQGQGLGVLTQGVDSDGQGDRELPVTLPERLPEVQEPY